MVTNTDEEDIKRHENIEDWWNVKGTMFGLHAMNCLRITLISLGLVQVEKLKMEALKTDKYLNCFKVIDVGCSVGILCEPLAKLGAEVTGIDPSEKLINIAKKHATENVQIMKSPPIYHVSTIEDFSIDNANKYDVLVASEVIEHVPDKQQFLESCVKTLKPGGSIFLTTPNRSFISWICNIIIAENVLKLIPKGIHDWNKFVTPLELKDMLNKCGCTTVLTSGMIFNIVNSRWNWSYITLLHYAIHAVKRNDKS